MCYEKKSYLIQRVGFTKFQALFRAYKARKEFCEQKKAAVIIQRKFRSYIARRKYLIIKSSVLKIQNYYRGYRLMCLEKEKYLIQKIGFIELQAQFRAYKARKEFYMQKRAAISIQSTFKSYITRKRFLRLRLCAIKIQKYYRSYCLMSSDRRKYLIQKAGFTKLQACFQGFKVRRKFVEQKRAVVVMQSQFRSYINRKKFLILKSCAIKIQKFYRGYRLMCFQKQNYLIQKNGFLKLQAQFRAFKARKEFCMQKRSVVVIQNAFKCYIIKKKYFILKSSVVKIQRCYRGYKLMCLEKQKYLTMQTGFTKLQALCRGIIARSYFKILLKSTVIIQSHCKKMIVMNHYKKTKQSCIIIQQKYRAQQLMNKAVLKFQKIKRSIIIIQSAVRSYLVRKKYKNMKIAAIKIQSFARMVKCRKTYNYTCRQIIFIQQFYHAKYLMRLRKQSCIKIQSCWKSYKTRKELDRKIRAAEVIQRYFHLWREKKPHIDCAVNRQWYLKLKESTIFFQRQARIYLQRRTKSAILIQSYVRMWLTRLKYIRIKAAIKIQTLWRGYKVRQSVTDKNIIKSRQNIKAAPSSEHKSLGNRTKFALNLLLKNQNLATILHALQNLEVCTRLSPTCCERLKESGGISIILQAISVCNRSVPHQEIIKFSTDILLNLAKMFSFKSIKTVDSVWAEEAILTEGLRLMGVYRDKGLPIFTKCCTLFWIFCQDPKKKNPRY
ncbi:abnormal spindle-like microcephaly-associated protein homolog [Caerostris extrusa]|uniref:Abnormal spindle-like microcephaly-associated protein homolog n=1 Tax=Caerostris extrusa TaxID=172846 RepID=A0AAV4MB90_CAEEX|nr:abnormal spindle-like microcephaly-associated protein homolog [Caerostris extrusa]